MPFRTLFPALLAAALAFHPKLRPRTPSLRRGTNDDLAAFSLNDLKTLAAARGIDVSGMTEKAQVAEALKAPRTPPPEEEDTPAESTGDEVPFDPLAALIGADGVALDGSAFAAAADQPMDDLDFDPRVSPHAYEAAPAAVGIIIVDHGSKVAAANERLERLCEGYATTRAPKHWIVRPAHMELASPSISEAFDALVEAGCATIVCHPFFLSQGRHVREDVPALLDEAASRHNIPYSLTPPLGQAPALLDLVHDVVSAGVKDATPDQDDGGFGFFGAIAEMIEAENSR
jgi:sirohydrochlorin ferrochelatase